MNVELVVPARLSEAVQLAGFSRDHEAGAWALFSEGMIDEDPWAGEQRRKLILKQLYPLTREDIASSSATHLTVKTENFVRVLAEAKKNGLTPGFLHGHPSGYDAFSLRDDENESALLRAATNRNGAGAMLASILTLPNGTIRGRVWGAEATPTPASVIISGERLSTFDHSDKKQDVVAALDRQARVFGEPFNETLAKLRVLVVGAGGTGSPLAVMLARAGTGYMAVIDPDVVEETNLHRLHGATSIDIGVPKAICIQNHIRAMGLGMDIRGMQGNILDFEQQDLLKAADVIFCATDDHAGRLLLNRYAYFYETPVIDLGLAIAKDDDERIRDMTGRITLLYPGAPCLLCRRVIDPRRAREEELSRRDPEGYARQTEDGYIIGGGDPEPAFIAMTTSVACMAMEELAQLVSSFRGTKRRVFQRLRRFQIPEDRNSGGAAEEDCPICGTADYWGVGDIKPFLDRVA
jgi:molybdopterin/thiamine biosynthesis adenylyltransferase